MPAWSRDALWRTAPRVLLRYPALFAAALAGTALLTLAAAAYPLFLSATSSEIVAGAIERGNVTRYQAGLTYRFEHMPLEPVELVPGVRTPSVDAADAAVDRVAARSPILGAPLPEVVSEPLTLASAGRTGTQLGRLFAAPDAPAHVERLAGAEGDGVWVPELIAEDLGVGPGDVIRLAGASGGAGGTVDVAVDGIYDDIYFAWPSDGFWLEWQNDFRLRNVNSDIPPPPQPILADRDQAIAIALALGQRTATFVWQAPIAPGAEPSLEDVQALRRYASTLHTGDFADTALGRTLLCCIRRWAIPLGSGQASMDSAISAVVDEAESRIATVQGPAEVLEIAAVAVALVVVAAAGASSMRARRTEAAWLFARGISPLHVAVGHVLSSLLPAVVGGAIGLALAGVAVRTIGPDGAIDRSAIWDAVTRTGVAVAGGIVLAAVVAARTYVRIVDPHGRRLARLAAAVPWELVAIWLGYVAYQRLRGGGAFFVDERLGVERPSLALVAFPFLTLAGLAFLAGRLLHAGFRRLRGPTTDAAPPLYLATRRLAASGPLAVALIGTAGLCLGMFVHARLVSVSLQATVSAKARAYVGSESAVQIAAISEVPTDLPVPVTRVVQVGEGIRLASGRPLDLLAIDPDTFADAAYWNPAFGAGSLDDLVERIRDPAPDAPLPVIVASGPGLALEGFVIGTEAVPAEVVETVTAFPGLFSFRPLVVVDERALLARLDTDPFAHGWAELWTHEDVGALQEVLGRADIPAYQAITAAEVEDIPAIAAALKTFVIVNTLGTIAAALTIVSTILYLRARQRSQIVSYALSTRMGMTHAQHRRALAVELGLMVGAAFVVGTALAIAAAWVVLPFLDPIESIPPEPLFIVPRGPIVATAIVVGLVTWVGAAIVDRRARAADLAEVMRVAG